MKRKFSSQWISSSQPRKQRKFLANAPLHIKHKFLSANLSKSLREKYGKRSIPIRKGDEVLVMRGAHRKSRAKVSIVDLKSSRVALDNVQRAKRDGTKINVFLSPSILQLQSLNLDDKERVNALNRKAGLEEKNASQKAGSSN